MTDAYHTDTQTHDGIEYRVEYHFDHDMGAPWEEHDGHGIVSDWVTRAKKPGEVEIHSGGYGVARYYDIPATLEIARRDRWGASTEWRDMFVRIHDREPTVRESAAQAVNEDIQRMRDWCWDKWRWCGVVVFPLSADGDELRSKSQSLWGIESDAYAYLDEVVAELIAQGGAA